MRRIIAAHRVMPCHACAGCHWRLVRQCCCRDVRHWRASRQWHSSKCQSLVPGATEHEGSQEADLLLNHWGESQVAQRGWKRLVILVETPIILLDMPKILPEIAEARIRTAGQRIRRRRQELGLNQTQLARAAELTQGFLSALETGRRQLAPKTLERLAQALDLPSAVIVGQGSAHDSPQPYEATPLPLFGSIPAGPPSQTQEQAENWPVLKHLWSPDYYCLRLAFDSMEPTLKPGDIVLVHYRADVNPLHVQGKICACLIDGDQRSARFFGKCPQ